MRCSATPPSPCRGREGPAKTRRRSAEAGGLNSCEYTEATGGSAKARLNVHCNSEHSCTRTMTHARPNLWADGCHESTRFSVKKSKSCAGDTGSV